MRARRQGRRGGIVIALGVLVGAVLAVGLALVAFTTPAPAFLGPGERTWMIACGSPLAAAALGFLLVTVPRRPLVGRLALIALILALSVFVRYYIFFGSAD